MKIEVINWKEYPVKPLVEFEIFQLNKGIQLKFCVEECGCKAVYTKYNEPVYKDSCVEFFVDPIGDGLYYNFEFNCIGNVLLACGKSRENRIYAPIDIMKSIICTSSLGNKPFQTLEKIKWELDIFIPFTVFFQHKVEAVSIVKCNFYKCGDETPDPHYLTWVPVKTQKPDFHRPEYFGLMQL